MVNSVPAACTSFRMLTKLEGAFQESQQNYICKTFKFTIYIQTPKLTTLGNCPVNNKIYLPPGLTCSQFIIHGGNVSLIKVSLPWYILRGES